MKDFYKIIIEEDLDNVVKYYEDNPELDLHYKNDFAFLCACKHGKLDIAMWIYNTSKNSVNIHTYNDQPFIWACQNGFLDLAQWMLTLEPKENFNKINVDQLFRLVAYNDNNCNVIKWLISIEFSDNIKRTLHANNDSIFKICSVRGNIEILKTILEIEPFKTFRAHIIYASYKPKMFEYLITNKYL